MIVMAMVATSRPPKPYARPKFQPKKSPEITAATLRFSAIVPSFVTVVAIFSSVADRGQGPPQRLRATTGRGTISRRFAHGAAVPDLLARSPAPRGPAAPASAA